MEATLDGVSLPRVELKIGNRLRLRTQVQLKSSKITYSGGHFKAIDTYKSGLVNLVAYEYLWMRWLNASEGPRFPTADVQTAPGRALSVQQQRRGVINGSHLLDCSYNKIQHKNSA